MINIIKLVNLILILYNQLDIGFSQYNLYHTETNPNLNPFDYDCLYQYLDYPIPEKYGLFPWCIRQETFDKDLKRCDGNEITFKQLKINNISVADLLHWNAVVEIMDLYEKYLLLPNLVNENEIYCNCSHLLKFGKFCEYDIDRDDNDERMFTSFFWFSDHINNDGDVFDTPSTCFIGIQCQTNLVCLDWRQICNGIVDCDSGEDEPAELCLQMESNECDVDKEFRCQIGVCIPFNLQFSSIGYCFDRSDWSKTIDLHRNINLFQICSQYPSTECDEINHGWKKFSCHNGQYMSFGDLTLKTSQSGRTCGNNYHLMYLKELFSNKNEEDRCWKSMICLTGFDYLFSQINCSPNKTTNDCDQVEFYFPSNSIVYSYVFFLYENINRNNWLIYSGPNAICYKKDYCPNKTWTFTRQDLVCFYVDEKIFSWKNFYEYVVQMFSSCYSSSHLPVHIKANTLYQCNLSQTFISIYRVKDKTKDCFFNEDENKDIDLCSLKINGKFECFTNSSECIRQLSVFDKEYDCSDGSDEYFETVQTNFLGPNDNYHPWRRMDPNKIYRFNELCDNFINRHIFPKESNETDETDCEHWLYSCDSPYTNCDQIWNCRDGHDELNCGSQSQLYNSYIRERFHCKTNEHYCLKLINHGNDINMTCLDLNRINDGIIDCIGETDERLTNICIEKYPIDHRRRFHCQNSSECIRTDEVCDGKVDCPFEDDERICPWLFKSNSSIFRCQDALSNSPVRCDRTTLRNRQCQMKEQLWFCDLETIKSPTNQWPVQYDEFPQYANQMTQLFVKNNDNKWLCNFGFRIRSSIIDNKFYCLCPPTYYGEFCQFQSEHLIVILKIKVAYPIDKLTVFRLIIYLFNADDFILSYEEIIYSQLSTFDGPYYAYLMYERVKQLSLQQRTKSRYIRIDSYIINQTSVEYISSWKYSVLFPFLPVNKLIVELSLVNQSFRMFNCKKRCGSHGRCMFYLNSKEKEYCWCEQGWFGEYCQNKSLLNLCNQTSCAPYSQCIIINNQSKCLCSLGRFGDQCYIKHNSCTNNQCPRNGTCLPMRLNKHSSENLCICQDNFDGANCDSERSPSRIYIDKNITDIYSIRAIICITGMEFRSILQQLDRFLFDKVTSPIVIRTISRAEIGLIRVYFNFTTNFYYLVFIQLMQRPSVNASLLSTNRCKNISELFNQTILNDYSYLKRLKMYHLPCSNDSNLKCFFDEHRMCLCTNTRQSHCLLFSHSRGDCNECFNDGICLKSHTRNSDLDDNKFVCICSDCTDGSRCQFLLGNYYVTLDMLIGKEMKRGETSFAQQPTVIHLTLLALIVILVFSFIFNIISIIILSKKKLRQVGCDLYLLTLAIFSQIGLIFLLLRFIYMIISQMYIIDDQSFLEISCILLEYLVRLFPSIFDWLTVCISMERTYMIIKDVHFTQIIGLKTLKLSRWIILIVVSMNVLTTLHRPFHLILTDEIIYTGQPQGHPWCVLHFQSTLWNNYEKVINICHLVIPLIFNISSVMFFLLRRTQVELTSTVRKDKRTRQSVLIEQILKYKPLLISTIMIILLQIPRFVLTFTLSCFKHRWQRYVHLFGYLLSFLPLSAILFIYILPSPKHYQEFKAVCKRISYFRFFSNK